MPVEEVEIKYRIGPLIIKSEPVLTLIYGGEMILKRGHNRNTGEIKELRARYVGVDDRGIDEVDKFWVRYHPAHIEEQKEDFIGSISGEEINKDPDMKGKLRWRCDSIHQGYELRDLARRRSEDLLQSCLEDLVAR